MMHNSAVVAQGMLSCPDPRVPCPYPGSKIRWQIIDVRLYPRVIRDGWLRTHAGTPFRVYVDDQDDWSVETAFSSEDEAQGCVALLRTGDVTLDDLMAVGMGGT